MNRFLQALTRFSIGYLASVSFFWMFAAAQWGYKTEVDDTVRGVQFVGQTLGCIVGIVYAIVAGLMSPSLHPLTEPRTTGLAGGLEGERLAR